MLHLPTREALAALSGMAAAVAPHAVFGISRYEDADHVSVLYSFPLGLGCYRIPVDELPSVLTPTGHGMHVGGPLAGAGDDAHAIEWQVSLLGAARLVSWPIPDVEPATRLWIGLREAASLDGDHIGRFEDVARECGRVLREAEPPPEHVDRLHRLELTSALLPTLFKVLDVRDVFDRLSATARLALPHDMLTLGLFSDDFSTMTVHALSGTTVDSVGQQQQPYPPAITRAWVYDIVDDRTSHPLERDRPATKMGFHSSLRVQIRIDDRLIGGLGFMSAEPRQYTSADVAIARRLGDLVTVALSHHELAEAGRRAATLRERAANLEMLDGLLTTLMGVLDIRQVFDRVSEIADTVLPHDALAIAEILDDGDRVRVHVTQGLGPLATPFDVATPDRRLVIEAGDYTLVDDLAADADYAASVSAQAGMRSMLIAPIRVAGRQYGGLVFYAKAPSRYSADDVLVARRIADHVALALSHQQLAEHAKDNASLRSRTANLELLDELLATQINADDLDETCGRISASTRPVLPHDALTLAIILPNGTHARVYSTSNVPANREPVPIPPVLLANPNWEHEITDRISSRTEPHHVGFARLGFESALRVPIRLEGRFAGAVIFLSRTPAAFTQTDLLIVRRIAERMALVLSRDRELAAAKRAAEASEKVSRLESRVQELTEELDARTGFRRVVGSSPEWRGVLTQAAQVAPNDTTVLLLGESGTGKEVIARFVHRASPRTKAPFIALNCAALPEQLLEAELFGYERGAFTGALQSKPGQLEQAAGGTLFLDEVGEMSLAAQAKFLRVLQEREFQRLGGTRVLRTDARIVAATNRDLRQAIAEKHFREDLYYRLNVFALRLPPLRERRADVIPLSEAFVMEIGRNISRAAAGISGEARERLIGYHWPGNVRELRNVLERASILCEGGWIRPEHLAIEATASQTIPARAPAGGDRVAVTTPERPASAGDLRSIERDMVEQALREARFNKSRAAKALGLTRQQLYLRMKRYGLE